MTLAEQLIEQVINEGKGDLIGSKFFKFGRQHRIKPSDLPTGLKLPKGYEAYELGNEYMLMAAAGSDASLTRAVKGLNELEARLKKLGYSFTVDTGLNTKDPPPSANDYENMKEYGYIYAIYVPKKK